jgi:undecaprenyl-phosphate galactose phosphotransferase/putative colanic acid biosynthesis UDP-glucose lipid carrier transferase
MSYLRSPAAAGIAWRNTPQRVFTYGNVGPITAIIDCVVIVAASIAAGVAYHLVVLGTQGDIGAFAGVGANSALLFVLLGKSRGMYRPAALLWASEWRRIIASWVAVVLAMVSFLFLLKLGESSSRGAMIVFSGLGLGLLLLSRAAIANRLRSALARGRVAGKRAIMVGERDELDHRSGSDLLRKYAIREVGRFELPDGRSDDRSVKEDSLAVLSAAVDAARSNQADVVLLALRWTDKARYELARDELRALPVPVVLLPDQSVRSILAQPMAEMGPDIAVQVQRAPLGSFELSIKRTLDVMAAGAALALLAPLLLIVGAAIKLTSPGPVIFKQDRRGFNGQKFKIYKFRTMTVMENGGTIEQAQPNDRRVTPLGAFLRSSSIDELPQLINVLRGEMSLVGPRPHAVAHDEKYSKLIGTYPYRHHVKPGITGWAQVNGFRGETGRIELMERRVDFDLWYVSNWSVWLDLKILARTCLQVTRDSNAY